MKKIVFAFCALSCALNLSAQTRDLRPQPLPAQPAPPNFPRLQQPLITTQEVAGPNVKIADDLFAPKAILDIMQRVADWQLAHPSISSNRPATGWVQAAGDIGMMALVGISGDARYRDAVYALGETNGWQLGHRLYDADDYAVAQAWAEMYLLYREPKMIAPTREKFDDILAHPSQTTTLKYGKKEDPKIRENWAWADSLFMGPPAWLRLYSATGDERYLNFAVTNWWRTTDFLYDKDEHLFFRDSTYFDKKEANGKKVFWGRGNGWVMAGLVRVLQSLPMNHPDRVRFEQLFKEMAAKVLTCQQPDGLWRASLLDPASYPLKETSGSGFYTYALAWGVNQGLLDRAQFEPAVRKAWAALVSCVDADGKLTHVQPIGADPKNFAEDSTEVYGIGAFLLAGSEVYKMVILEKFPMDLKVLAALPIIQFNDTPLTTIIETLARQAGIKYTLDPKIGYGQPDENGKIKPEPAVSIGWRNITPKQALNAVLDNYDLQLVSNPNTGASLITKKNPNQTVEGITAVSVKNPSSFRRECETVELNLTGNYVVMDGLSSQVLNSQVYRKPSEQQGERQFYQDKLLFQVDLAPDETRTFYILNATALPAVPPPIVKTMARYVPERFDDFAWESDRIAHRIYGQALIKAEGTISSGADVWIKKDRGLIVDTMYATKHYHEDNGSFMDDYRVGKSRGCGGLGIWDGKKLYVSSNWKNWKLITTGPIRSEFELTYDAWDAGNGRMVSEVKRFSIDAGSWLTKVTSTISSDDKTPLTIGIGVAERACPTNREEFIAHDLTEGWLTYWQPEDKPKGTTAVAVLLPKGAVKEFTNDNPTMPDSVKHANVPQPTHEGYPPIRTQLAITQFEVGQPFSYYFGACWDRSGDFTNHEQWEDYLKRFAARRDQPLTVTGGN